MRLKRKSGHYFKNLLEIGNFIGSPKRLVVAFTKLLKIILQIFER
jgi:hypothetical protein